MSPAKPSLDLLRALTDEHVVRALMVERRLTRAEVAARTGLSKPTVSESVRRLTEAGLLRDTGERTTGRGRIGSYYALADDVGAALVVSLAPEGVVAEAVDVHGSVVTRQVEDVGRPARPEEVEQALQAVATRVADVAGPLRLAVVSAADPVDRVSGRLVHLPDAPFLVGELSPAAVLAPHVTGPVRVDNDVNWAARAERAAATDPSDDVAYLHLGEGLGCAVVSDGEVRRGAGGLAGEVAHLVTRGPGGRALAFTEVFAELGLRRPGSPAVDVDALLRAVDASDGRPDGALAVLTEAVCGVLSALVALADPRAVVVGGSWGTAPAVLAAVVDGAARLPRPVAVRAAQAGPEPALTAARTDALDGLREAVVARLRPVDG